MNVDSRRGRDAIMSAAHESDFVWNADREGLNFDRYSQQNNFLITVLILFYFPVKSSC